MNHKPYKEIKLEQGTPEWLSLRRNLIGASDSSAILGCGYKSANKLYNEKMSDKPVIMNDAMKRGSQLEPIARQHANEILGVQFIPIVCVSIRYPWLLASLDGWHEETQTILEIKCGGAKLHANAREGKIPNYYISQMQHQMAVTGSRMCYYYSFDGEDDGVCLHVNRDDGYIKDYLPKSKYFWDCMQDYMIPDMKKFKPTT